MRVLCILSLIVAASAKFCLRDEAPTKVKINDNGQPELTCEQPKACEIPGSIKMHTCKYYKSMCTQRNEWVGGIHDSDKKYGIACCQSPYLVYSRVLGSTKLFPGDVFAGGAWQSKSGTRRGFDVVSNIQRHQTNEGVMFEVTVARVTCPQRPPIVRPSQLIATPHNKYDQISNVAGNLQYENFEPQTDTQVVDLGPAAPAEDFGGFGDGGFGDPGFIDPGFAPPVGLPPAPATGLCFPEDAKITTPTGIKLMKDLRIGDKVLTIDEGRIAFSKVESWLHRYPEMDAEFVQLGLKDGTDLTLTPDHFIYYTPCNAISTEWELTAAKDIQPMKDCVVKVVGESMKLVEVVSSERVIGHGVYGPMTATTNIVVNDLAASCYAMVKDTTLLASLLEMAQGFDTLCDSAARALGFNSGLQKHLNEMPTSLAALMNVADMVFHPDWKVMG